MNNNFTACVQSVCHQHAHMISDGRVIYRLAISILHSAYLLCAMVMHDKNRKSIL